MIDFLKPSKWSHTWQMTITDNELNTDQIYFKIANKTHLSNNNELKIKYYFEMFLEEENDSHSVWGDVIGQYVFLYKNLQFNITLPYSIEKIQYDLFKSKNRIFPDEITISSNESLNPGENIDNFNNVQNSANQIVNNFNTYVNNSSNDFAKMGANTNHIMVKNIDYSQLKDNKHFTITLQLSDAFAKLIPIANDFMDQK